MKMTKYKCHKVVEAAPVEFTTDDAVHVKLNDVVYGINVGRNFYCRGRPDKGDYIVRYENGYLSWSPKAAFEAGYTRL